jgi:hypothetical protein
MNDIKTIDDIPKSFDDLNIRNTAFIKAEIEFEDGSKKVAYAANDICIGNSVLDYYNFDVKCTGHEAAELAGHETAESENPDNLPAGRQGINIK